MLISCISHRTAPTLRQSFPLLYLSRSYNHKVRARFPRMSAVGPSDVLARLDGLQVQYKVVEHEAVKNGQEWRKALEGKGVEGGWELTKTLLFKPKTAKSATPTPVFVVARESTETSSSSIARLLNLKELRLANEDLIKDVLPGIGGKDDVSPLPLPAPLSSHLHVLLDSALASTPLVAAHTTTSASTVLLSGSDLVRYVRSLQEGGEGANINPAAGGTGVREVDFAAMKSEDIAEKPLGSAAGAKAEKAAQAPVSKMEKEGRKVDAYELAISYTKEGDFPNWYSDVLIKGDMLDYYDVSGCYILKPWSYTVWQHIQTWFDGKIKELGVDDCYFPMFVSNARLEKEKDHIEGFAPEVAWVTRAGTKDLDEPIAIRPTSETVMYPYYAKWIRSHRDLPLKLNQWNSVVRWEFKNPQPFLRTREFLWQEGHTAFLTKKEADDEVMNILDLYRRVYEELLAVPVIPGVKSENEKFAGGLYTTTVEGFVPATGRGIQGATSHCLGQNFSKMFDISVEDPAAAKNKVEGQDTKVNVWQNSWGLSTRSIGVMVMVHGDDQGLVMPPRVSNIQVVIVPVGVTARTAPEEREKIEKACSDLQKDLAKAGVRAKADLRDGYTPGWKFNDWELRGVPVRLEIGPRDLAAGAARTVRRYDGHKEELSLATITTEMPKYLEAIQEAMFQRAKKVFEQRVVKVEKWDDVVPTLDAKNAIIIPWCEGSQCEDDIKAKSARISLAGEAQDEKAPSAGAKSLCIPFDQARFGELKEGTKCIGCGETAKRWTMFGRSY